MTLKVPKVSDEVGNIGFADPMGSTKFIYAGCHIVIPFKIGMDTRCSGQDKQAYPFINLWNKLWMEETEPIFINVLLQIHFRLCKWSIMNINFPDGLKIISNIT